MTARRDEDAGWLLLLNAEEMEPKHKELLEKCYQNLVESITDADRVVDVLAHCGTLSQSERFELGHNCSSSSEKVDHLLKILLGKDRDHFAEFCTALEQTHPHLHSALLNGTGPVDHTTGKKLLGQTMRKYLLITMKFGSSYSFIIGGGFVGHLCCLVCL